MATFDSIFAAFSKFGNTNSDGKTINLSQSDKWMKQAGVFTKNLTTTDTAIAFNKFKNKALDASTYEKYLELLCKEKNLVLEEIKSKLTKAGFPGTNKTTQPAGTEVVSRLTDTTKYTGSHKERFDAAGQGKGKEGREDVGESSGYVQGYKNENTYDKKH